MQANPEPDGRMFHAPRSSPWGEVQNCEVLCPGVFLVSTASHGGTMVANEVAAVLSPGGEKMRFQGQGLYLPMRRTHRKSVVLRELLDKKALEDPPTVSRTKSGLKKTSISPSGNTIPNTGGQDRADGRPPKPPAAQPRPKRPQGSFGPCWPEAAKEV